MSDQLFSVSGQHVLITGGSCGMGRAIAKGFATRGAKVMICSRNRGGSSRKRNSEPGKLS